MLTCISAVLQLARSDLSEQMQFYHSTAARQAVIRRVLREIEEISGRVLQAAACPHSVRPGMEAERGAGSLDSANDALAAAALCSRRAAAAAAPKRRSMEADPPLRRQRPQVLQRRRPEELGLVSDRWTPAALSPSRIGLQTHSLSSSRGAYEFRTLSCSADKSSMSYKPYCCQ